jgi:DNA-binding NtrC family response regulator
MRPPAAKTPVLILARESVIAALIGMLLELEAYEPVFPEPDERPEDAIRRVRPPLVVVLDGESDEARSDLFFARASQSGARVVLFGEPVAARAVRAAARTRQVPFFAMPVDRATLGNVLAHAVD